MHELVQRALAQIVERLVADRYDERFSVFHRRTCHCRHGAQFS